jgi:hypothetical protein
MLTFDILNCLIIKGTEVLLIFNLHKASKQVFSL